MKHYEKCNCPDEEIYLSEDGGYYDLYIKEPYFEKNAVKDEEAVVTLPPENAASMMPAAIWEGHEKFEEAAAFAWQLAFRHVRIPTPENGFKRSYIDTSFNGNTFMGDSSSMMWFCKYAENVFDFTGTLDNFYAKQHIDGYICREIRGDDGRDRFHRFDPVSVGPVWLAFTEMYLYNYTKNKARIEKAFDPLMGLHRWLKKHRTNPDGSYWYTGLSSTMDNQPRQPAGYSRRLDSAGMSWLDADISMLLDADALIEMGKILGRSGETKELEEERKFLFDYIVNKHWDKKRRFLFDIRADGTFNDCKTVGAFWALHIADLPEEITEGLISHLVDEREFNRMNPVPSISADSAGYDPNGLYWRGGVWPCMCYMVFSGLKKKGRGDIAFMLAKKHNAAIVGMYEKTGTLWEVSAPDEMELSIPSEKDFVGWTALSVTSDLYEFVLGIDRGEDEIVWNVRLTEEHGIKNYPYKGKTVDLIAKKRNSPSEEPTVTVRGDAKVLVIWEGGQKYV